LTREHIPLGNSILQQMHRRRWWNFRSNKWWEICMTRSNSILKIEPFVTELQSAIPFGISEKYMKKI
jgi:hypothetical protein